MFEKVVIGFVIGVLGTAMYFTYKDVDSRNYRAILSQCLLKDTAANCAAALKEIQK